MKQIRRGPPLLDGEEPLPTLPPRRRRALGHDPLAELEGAGEARDPLASLEVPPAPGKLGPRLRAVPRPPVPQRKLADVKVGPPADLFDRLLDTDVRRRIELLRELAPEGGAPDPFGFTPDVARRTLPLALTLYRRWFGVTSEGHEHLPREGSFVLVANHGGLLPFDAAMTVTDVLLRTDPPRLVRPLADRFVERVPGVRSWFPRLGAVTATRESFRALLREGHAVLVFPEGIDGIKKPVSQRYRLQHFHTGFVRHALQAGVPVVPAAILGSDDQAPILYDVKPLARVLGLPVAPITPTFPWFGPFGLLPYPVRYHIVYGEPFDFHTRYGSEAAQDARLVRYLANQVRRSLQQTVDRLRS